jgi:hypothetical protein
MIDALKAFGSGKIVTLVGNAAALGSGGFVIGDTPCLVQVTSDIRTVHGGLVPSRSSATDNGTVWSGGGAANTRDATETSVMRYRGKFKVRVYRGTPEMLSHPVSIWATTDKSRQSMFLFGVNSLIRMWGEDQVLDLNGFKIHHHERPNRFAAFSVLVDLSDGHFAALSTKGAKNAHIYCSKGTGVLGRNNHFAIRGHFVDGLLIDNVISGEVGTLNNGSYFGTVILNKSSNIVVKDLQQVMVNKAVALSSAGLSFYNQLVNQELVFGFFETPSTWSSQIAPGVPKSDAYPWLKWEDIDVGSQDFFGNGKKSVYPVLKTADELKSSLTSGTNAEKLALAEKIVAALDAAKTAYSKSMKSADDVYIQVHTAFSRNHPAFNNGPGATGINIPHTTNALCVNPANDEGLRYPDSVGYGFRIGFSEEGVGPLADVAYEDQAGQPRLERGVKNIHIMDSSFKAMHLSPMEAVSLGVPGKGKMKTFNGMGLRPFGYHNSNSDVVSVASSLLHMSQAAMEQAAPGLRLEGHPVQEIQTTASISAQEQGLYKGNDIAEASLAMLEAIGLLRKYFPQSSQLLSGVDNSAIDIGILALRKSMMDAIDAKTASNIGVRGGYNGDIWGTDSAASGSGSLEVYPWYVKKDGSINIDKDTEWTVQQPGNPATPAQIKANRKLSQGYLAVAMPQPSDTLFRLEMVDAQTLRLVRTSDGQPVTYQQCADLLGFSVTSMGAPADMSAVVEYKLLRNLDGQNHVHKGAFGVRVDEAEEVSVSNCLIEDFETIESKAPTKYLGSRELQVQFGINSESEPESGVLDIHGVSINSCEYVEISDIVVKQLAAGQEVSGVEIRGKSEKVSVERVLAEELSGEKVIGLKVAPKTKEITLKDISASELSAEHSGLALEIEIESASVKLS